MHAHLYQRDGKPNERNWILVTVITDDTGKHIGGHRLSFHLREQAVTEAAARGWTVAA